MFSIVITARKRNTEIQTFHFWVMMYLLFGHHPYLCGKKTVRLAKLTAVSREVVYTVKESWSLSFHRPQNTTPDKPTAIVMKSANPLAILAGAWPVYGEGEGIEVEVLDVEVLDEDLILEVIEALKSTSRPPTLKHKSFTRAKVAAR